MTARLVNELDKRSVAETFGRAASRYDDHDFLQREVARRAFERLDYVTLTPARIVDLGSGTGRCARELAARYRRASVVQCDLALGMLQHAREQSRRLFSRHRYVCADAEALPFVTGSIDLVFSNLSLQWCGDLERAFGEIRRSLGAGGLLMFTTLGPDTLSELRQAWSQVSDSPRVNRFFDMHDIGDALVASGFAEPVMEAEHITVTYDEALSLMRDLKGLGASNAAPGRSRGLLGKRVLRSLIDAYEPYRTDGKLPATWEVIYGHAWAVGEPALQRGDVHTFPLSNLKRRG